MSATTARQHGGGNDNLWIIAADGAGEPRNLTADARPQHGLAVGADDAYAGLSAQPAGTGRPMAAALFVLASTRGDTPLWRVPLAAARRRRSSIGRAQVQSFAFCAAGTTLAINLADHLNNGDVFCADRAKMWPARRGN